MVAVYEPGDFTERRHQFTQRCRRLQITEQDHRHGLGLLCGLEDVLETAVGVAAEQNH